MESRLRSPSPVKGFERRWFSSQARDFLAATLTARCRNSIIEKMNTDSETAETTPESPASLSPVGPSLQLSRRGLIFSLLAMVTAGALVYGTFPDSVGGPSLPVEARVDRLPVETRGGGGAVVTDVVVITSKSDDAIPRLSIEINGQYLLFRDSPLEAREELVLPLRVFTDKRSSQRYNAEKYPPKEIVVTGQLPSGARGLTQVELGLADH